MKPDSPRERQFRKYVRGRHLFVIVKIVTETIIVRLLTEQVCSFVHVSYEVVPCWRQLLKQRVGVPVERKILYAAFRRCAGQITSKGKWSHWRIGLPTSITAYILYLVTFNSQLTSDPAFRNCLGLFSFFKRKPSWWEKMLTDREIESDKFALYLVPMQPSRSMSSSGVDSMIAMTSDFCTSSVPSNTTSREPVHIGI